MGRFQVCGFHRSHVEGRSGLRSEDGGRFHHANRHLNVTPMNPHPQTLHRTAGRGLATGGTLAK